eukprot:COSAG05_NODE_7520_length_801_cov_2.870370_1_plen_107_part_00
MVILASRAWCAAIGGDIATGWLLRCICIICSMRCSWAAAAAVAATLAAAAAAAALPASASTEDLLDIIDMDEEPPLQHCYRRRYSAAPPILVPARTHDDLRRKPSN